jgi:hypothetical protein
MYKPVKLIDHRYLLFKTIEKPSVAEFKDKGSKFIAYAVSNCRCE